MEKHLNVDAVRHRMVERGLSPAGLAKSLEVSREAVSKWLSGESIPRPNKLLKLALLLGLKFDQLVSRLEEAQEPVVAFRKQGAHKTTNQHVYRAKDVGVLLFKKTRHENELLIFLPDSLTTWVYLNLDSDVHDFKFWMAHELGHIHAPSLRGDGAEDFADAFAAALLFPQPLATQAYHTVAAVGNKGKQMNRIKAIAETHVISPITVYFEINKYAQSQGLRRLDFGNAIYGAAKNLSKVYYSVSESLFDGIKPEPARYMEVAEKQFDSPFFAALKRYMVENEKGAGYIQTVLDTSLLHANALHAALI